MVVGRTRRATEGRQQAVLAHEAQHAVAPNRQPETIAQTRPHFPVPFALERGGREVGLDGGEQASTSWRK